MVHLIKKSYQYYIPFHILTTAHCVGQTYLSSTPATQIHYNPVYEPLQNLGEMVEAAYGTVICRKPLPPYHDSLNNWPRTAEFRSIYMSSAV